MLKVALIYLGRKGGGPVYSLEVAKRLSNQTELLSIISSQTEDLGQWQTAQLRLHKINTYNSAVGFFFSLLNLPKFYRLYRTIKSFSPNVIYYPFWHLWLPFINLLFPKIPKVYTCHDPILHSGENRIWFNWLQDTVIKQSRRVIILSSVFREAVKSRDINEKEIDVIPHGIFDYYQAVGQPNTGQVVADHRPTILFFGRILPYKGLDLILRALPLIKAEAPLVRLLVAGSGDLKPYQQLIEQNKESVEIVNEWIPDEQVAKYFRQSDILVCPYRDASQSGDIPIAYAFKMPVVATKVGGLIEQVDDQQTGFLVPAGNVESLAQACMKLLQDSDLRAKMGEQGYKKAKEEWGWDRVSQLVLQSLKLAI